MSNKKKSDADRHLKVLAYIAVILRIIAALVSIIKDLTD